MKFFNSTLAAFLIIFTLTTSKSTFAAQEAGSIKLVKGEVFILDAKTKAVVADPEGKKGRNTQKNSKFFEGEIIQTKASARVKLEFVEGQNEVVLGPSTSLFIERAGNDKDKKGTDLELKTGNVRSVVHKKYTAQGGDVFQVKTPNAVAGVRGTVFNVSFDVKTAKTSVLTESGLVSLMNRVAPSANKGQRFDKSNRSEVLVKAGTKSEVRTESPQPTPPQAASKQEIQQLKKMDDVESKEEPSSELSPSAAKNEQSPENQKADNKQSEKKKDDNVAVAMAPTPSSSMNEKESSNDRSPASANNKNDSSTGAASAKMPLKENNIMGAGGVEKMGQMMPPPQKMPFDIVNDMMKQQLDGSAKEATQQRLTNGVNANINFKIE